MQNIKSKLIFLWLALFTLSACAKPIQLKKMNANDLNHINTSTFSNAFIDKSQLFKFNLNGQTSYLLTTVEYGVNDGCYLHKITGSTVDTFLIHSYNQGLGPCAGVSSIYSCSTLKSNGIGVIYGVQVERDRFLNQNNFFDLSQNGVLQQNITVTNLLNNQEVASGNRAKKLLKCF